MILTGFSFSGCCFLLCDGGHCQLLGLLLCVGCCCLWLTLPICVGFFCGSGVIVARDWQRRSEDDVLKWCRRNKEKNEKLN